MHEAQASSRRSPDAEAVSCLQLSKWHSQSEQQSGGRYSLPGKKLLSVGALLTGCTILLAALQGQCLLHLASVCCQKLVQQAEQEQTDAAAPVAPAHKVPRTEPESG